MNSGLIKFPEDGGGIYYRDETASYSIKLVVPCPSSLIPGSLPFRGMASFQVDDAFMVSDGRGRLMGDIIFSSPSYYPSEPYLAVILVGLSACVYHLYSDDGLWIPTFDDLTDDGKLVHNLLSDVYPSSPIVLQTWIDDGFDILTWQNWNRSDARSHN
jgi:hypothetical protein